MESQKLHLADLEDILETLSKHHMKESSNLEDEASIFHFQLCFLCSLLSSAWDKMSHQPYMEGHVFHEGCFPRYQVYKLVLVIGQQLRKHYTQYTCKGHHQTQG
mmetsp:Transcript_2809/g.7492  ORF Transcript_2809/g.7492 Transcript_2809/m.7492 type:complete len:104 (-) Transcript_2809:503-814(-)